MTANSGASASQRVFQFHGRYVVNQRAIQQHAVGAFGECLSQHCGGVARRRNARIDTGKPEARRRCLVTDVDDLCHVSPAG